MNILNSIYPSPSVQGKTPSVDSARKSMVNPASVTKTSIFYINDVHGQIPKMQRLVSASEHAGLLADERGADLLRLSSGDIFIGKDKKRNGVAASFLNIAGIDAQAPGNHEFDITASICGNLLKDSKTKLLGMNLNFPDDDHSLAKKVMRSVVHVSDNGEKYGLIGIQPSDLGERVKDKAILEGITIDDKDQTIRELREEVAKLQSQGINKIFLLSHEGNIIEREIAQSVSGIDVILGGHSHDLIEGVVPGENLFYSPSGEPVLITQAGRDGNNFGFLNLEFNDKGQISYVQNNVLCTNTYDPNLIMSKTVDSVLGKSPVIGQLKSADPIPHNNLVEENPWADFVADAVRNQLGADIVLINAANFRGNVDCGDVTERDIQSIFPFNNTLFKVRINEKDIVDAIKKCGLSLSAKNSKPGLMQVSGLTYKLDKAGNVLEMIHTDKKGEKHIIDVNNPRSDKFYEVVYDEFLIGGGDSLDMLERDDEDILERYSFDKEKCTIDYIKTLAQPFEVHKDNRIQIV